MRPNRSDVFVTGDVHHPAVNRRYRTGLPDERACIPGYVDALGGTSCTLFVTGKELLEAPVFYRKLAGTHHIDIQLHGHDGFDWYPLMLGPLFRNIYGSSYGPAWRQERDIRRAIEAYNAVFSTRPVAWRTHEYACTGDTNVLLAKQGITVVSDLVDASRDLERSKNMAILPVNTIPDDDLYNATRTAPSDYLRSIRNALATKRATTLQMHPVLMAKDSFALMKRALAMLRKSGVRFRAVSELATQANAASPS